MSNDPFSNTGFVAPGQAYTITTQGTASTELPIILLNGSGRLTETVLVISS